MTSKTKAPSQGRKLGPQDKLSIPLAKPQARASGRKIKSYGGKFAQSSHDGAPAARKKFEGDWDELKYLYHKILYWYYNREDRRQASEFRDRFEELLKKLASRHPEAIFVEECWSVLYELDGDFDSAIEHREREIELILRLWKVSENTPTREQALHGYGVDALCDRLELLSILYHDSGNLDRAIVCLVESQRICESASLPYEGNDLLMDYLDEREPGLVVVMRGESSRRSRSGAGDPGSRQAIGGQPRRSK